MFNAFRKGFMRGYYGPPIREVIRRVIEHTGFTSVVSNPDAAVFKLAYDGHTYEVLLEEERGRVCLGVCSNARFPLRRIPPAIDAALTERNRELPKCDWKAFHGTNLSWPMVVAYCPFDAMDGETFMAGVHVLLEEANALDSGLRRAGLL